MSSAFFKLSEFFLIFIIIPIAFALDFNVWVKLILGLFGFIYIIVLLVKVEKLSFDIAPNLNWKSFFKRVFIKLMVIAVVTSLYVFITDKESLFNVVIAKPKLWVVILIVYSLFSVYPQELIYRTFFFKRYKALISNKVLFIFINAIVFSLGHIFFRNTLVLILTFFGGLLFAFTYSKTKSTILVSIEHAIYGSWLFTVGMGDMLGFPT
ncbi:CPBP family intramembrane metalloprotease [Flavobacteriaceae bacterium S0825]|uniref:CPBP family intramembrane glutamic endopeptidase n=1 Tax=Gaetbulibacter sp. S0825 TaxID=2720084 RepID=UPI001431D1A7|nr:CPBP family intramembrane glutamic endopeptidase [Gaetbulibacter sp. S0825]MCK0109506.1 CPBP family intramembrane metalloprotease [Flavobacteriaceae bacterium S0825]NIX65141.1 CPBP family intramembrane metalloprotease [Gaetbulibacter sp. S0825]